MAGKICNARGRLPGDYGPLINQSERAYYLSHIIMPFKFPASGKYAAILNLYVTSTNIMHDRSAKALFYVIKLTLHRRVLAGFCLAIISKISLERNKKKFIE